MWKGSDRVKQRREFVKMYLTHRYEMSKLCELYGVSRKTGYKTIARFKEGGWEGLVERSHAAERHPNATDEAIVEQVVRARHERPQWGPKKLLDWLRTKHPDVEWPAVSTVGAILKRAGLVKANHGAEAEAGALGGAAGLLIAAKPRAGTKQSTTSEEIVRKWYTTWEKTDVDQFVALMADNFTFTSPVPGDDHISASEFRKRCWDGQAGFIERFDLEHVLGNDDEVFVKYLCHTKNGTSFRKVEYFRLRDGKVAALECYFGGSSTFHRL